MTKKFYPNCYTCHHQSAIVGCDYRFKDECDGYTKFRVRRKKGTCIKDLKSCPFCGSKDGVQIEDCSKMDIRGKGYIVQCWNIYCDVQPNCWGEEKKEAIELWNKRST